MDWNMVEALGHLKDDDFKLDLRPILAAPGGYSEPQL
jgi:hypothetical protein